MSRREPDTVLFERTGLIGSRSLLGADGLRVEIDRSCLVSFDLTELHKAGVDRVRLTLTSSAERGNRTTLLKVAEAAWLRDQLDLAIVEAERVNGGAS